MRLTMTIERASARGFTLIEALIALAVLSVGLLGAAAMLLASLRGQADALRQVAATGVVRDLAERIRANPRGRAFYGTRDANVAPDACDAPAACDGAQRAAADLAHFASAARTLFPGPDTAQVIEYEPAIGPATPDRYVITLRWRDPRSASEADDEVVRQVLTLLPVAG
jgi:type IV pilus assembly protein PilV